MTTPMWPPDGKYGLDVLHNEITISESTVTCRYGEEEGRRRMDFGV